MLLLLYLHVNMVGLSIFCRLQVMLLGLSFVYRRSLSFDPPIFVLC